MVDVQNQDFTTLKANGNEEFKHKRYDVAIDHYSDALKLREDAVVYSNRSQCYINQGKFFDALRDCDTSLSLDSNYIKAYYRRATVYKNLSRYERAIEDFRTVITMDPTFIKCQADIDLIKKYLVTDARLEIKLMDKPESFRSKLELNTFPLNNQYSGAKKYSS